MNRHFTSKAGNTYHRKSSDMDDWLYGSSFLRNFRIDGPAAAQPENCGSRTPATTESRPSSGRACKTKASQISDLVVKLKVFLFYHPCLFFFFPFQNSEKSLKSTILSTRQKVQNLKLEYQFLMVVLNSKTFENI